MKHPSVTVIVPVRNEERLLRRCLASLTKQETSRPYEILVVDGNSTDKSRDIAKHFGVRVIMQKTPGKVYGFIEGVAAADADILCFTEADCVVPKDWVERIASYMEIHPDVSAITGWYVFDGANIVQSGFTLLGHALMHIFNRLYFGHHTIRASNSAIRKDAYGKSGGFSPDIEELYDMEIANRLCPYGAVGLLPSLIVTTSDRRIRGRLLSYAREAWPAIWARLTYRPFKTRSYRDIR